jgi:hypothetical protein
VSSIWGNKLKVSVFGESHGEAIGVVEARTPGSDPDLLEGLQQDCHQLYVSVLRAQYLRGLGTRGLGDWGPRTKSGAFRDSGEEKQQHGCGRAVTASAMSGSWQTYVADGESAIGVTDAWRSAAIV